MCVNIQGIMTKGGNVHLCHTSIYVLRAGICLKEEENDVNLLINNLIELDLDFINLRLLHYTLVHIHTQGHSVTL